MSKKIIKNSMYFLTGAVATSAANFIFLPIFTHLLPPHDYGVLANLVAFIQMFAVLASLYLDSSFNRFYFEYNDNKDTLRRFISTQYLFVCLWGSGVTIFALVFAKYYISSYLQVAFYPYLTLVSISPLLLQLALFGRFYLRNQGKAAQINIVDFVFVLFSLLLSFFLLKDKKMLLSGRIIGLFMLYLLPAIYYTGILMKDSVLGLIMDFDMLVKSLRYSIPSVPMASASWVLAFSDRLLVSWFGGFANAGIYDVAFKVGMLSMLASNAMAQAFSPDLIESYTKGQFKEFLYGFIPSYNIILVALTVVISVAGSPLIYLLFPVKYHAAATIIPLVAIGYFFAGHNKWLTSIFGLKLRPGLNTVGYIFMCVLNFVLNVIFIPLYGNKAAAISSSLSFLFISIWSIYWWKKLDPENFDIKFFFGIKWASKPS